MTVYLRYEDAYPPCGVLPSSEQDGWSLGYIGQPWPGPWPKRCGDLFVVEPGGWQAGISWESTGPDFLEILGPSRSRWGVFQVKFPFPVMGEDDLVRNFHEILPRLRRHRAALTCRREDLP
jgi:hypothetical protein